jgi:hypothetical protein
MVRKWTEDGKARMVAEFQRECYHNSTVPVKEYLEVIEGEGDSLAPLGTSRGQEGENRKVKMENWGEG